MDYAKRLKETVRDAVAVVERDMKGTNVATMRRVPIYFVEAKRTTTTFIDLRWTGSEVEIPDGEDQLRRIAKAIKKAYAVWN